MGTGLKEGTSGIASDLIIEVTDELNKDSTQLKIEAFTDFLLTTIRDSLNEKILNDIEMDALGANLIRGIQGQLADSLMLKEIHVLLSTLSEDGRKALNEIIDELLTGEKEERVAFFISSILSKAINQDLKQQLSSLTTGLLDSLISTATIDRFRSELLGKSTQDSLNVLLDSAMSIVINRINKDIKLKDQFSFIQKWAKELLLLAGLIIIGIIAFTWWKRKQHLRLSQLITTQINEMPNRKAYDDLTLRIQEKAREHNYEKMIRTILKDNGMLGQEDWEKTNNKWNAINKNNNENT